MARPPPPPRWPHCSVFTPPASPPAPTSTAPRCCSPIRTVAYGTRHSFTKAGDTLTRYHCEAGIAACHCLALTFAQTDWPQIIRLYRQFATIAPSPLVTLNHAVALTAGGQAATARQLLDEGIDRQALAAHHRYHAARAYAWHDHDPAIARAAYQRAVALAPLPAEREALLRRLDSLPQTP
ncbi:hypothetical protein [Actomonas aquatica]|uniref:RNA polymerase subunit sigma-24 n=1 Tax=Actomonas aquatica TaxID=2866162 RepID=A0ABZ1C334_9BACT|nr:hypothetical protein [Opitutus sp. WL0086]WRQ85668.1 hypothetical protein K1X11_012720 [Opitutus sp. WL0086]